ncbi:MAG: hypothetical protein CMH54_13150 [Myxococcales bacterium]|mgnify:CR=1 FL=1|nr:hypothetical protein [Myxococcales bacterium]
MRKGVLIFLSLAVVASFACSKKKNPAPVTGLDIAETQPDIPPVDTGAPFDPIKAAELEDQFIGLLTNNPDEARIGDLKDAIWQLGKLRSQKALPAVLRALFIDNNAGETTADTARVALGRIQNGVLESIETIFAGKDDEFLAWTSTNKTPEWEWRFGPSLIVTLHDIRQPGAAKVILNNLIAEFPNIREIDESSRRTFARLIKRRWQRGAIALADYRDDSILPKLIKSASDRSADTLLRKRLIWSLAMMGTPAARKGMFTIYAKEPHDQVRTHFMESIVLGLHPDDMATFEEKIRKPGSEEKQVGSQLTDNRRIKAQLELIGECQKDISCYIRVLQSEGQMSLNDMFRKEKAALFLAQQTPAQDQHFQIALEALKKTPSRAANLRIYLFLAIANHANSQHLDALKEYYGELARDETRASMGPELRMLAIHLEPR